MIDPCITISKTKQGTKIAIAGLHDSEVFGCWVALSKWIIANDTINVTILKNLLDMYDDNNSLSGRSENKII